MKTHVRQTLWLVGVLVVLIGIDMSSGLFVSNDLLELPPAPQAKLKELTRIRLATKAETVEFENADGLWSIVSPIEAVADQQAIQMIGQIIDRGIELELQIEENSDDLEVFGLKPGLLLEAYADSDSPAVSIYIGSNAAGGASFVRFPKSETVYRAQLGGIQRYDRPAAAWRNPVVAGFNPSTVKSFQLATQRGTLTFQRDNDSAPWTLQEDNLFEVDQEQVSEILSTLGGLRAGVVLAPDHPAGMETPVARVTLTGPTEEPIVITFGRTLAGAFAKTKGKSDTYQIAPSLTDSIANPKQAWYNRKLLSLERTEILKMSLTEQVGGTTTLEQDPATNRWSVIRPANVDANLRECMQAAIKLSSLSAIAIANLTAKEAGLPSPNFIEIEMLSGQKHRLEIGKPVPGMPKGKEAIFVRTANMPDRIPSYPFGLYLS
jgi:hypothetical protein